MDMRNYTSQRVFNGRRNLTNEEAEKHRERLNGALDKRKNDMTNDSGTAF
jgi:hypothetical protein